MAASGSVKMVYLTTIPGTQWSFLRGQNTYMRQRGFELHAVSSPGPLLEELARRDGVIVHAVPISRTITPLRDLVTLVSLYRALRRIRPTITHVSTPKAALLGSIAAWLARVPIRVFLVRGLITENARGPRRRLFRWLERLTSRLSHATICVAPSLLEFARAEGIVGPWRGTVMANGMSNGIDPRQFGPVAVKPAAVSWGDSAGTSDMAAPVVMGFVGRQTRDKGVEEIAAAWQSIRTEFPNARLLLVGPWEHEDPVSEAARRGLESDPRVLLVGQVADTAPYYKVMDLFLFPSHGTEGFPNAPMEAACMGLPVIASRVVGCVDAVVDGVTGTLVPSRNASALADAIRTYLRDPDLRRRHGRTGRERVFRDFRQEVIWEALYQEYVRLLREKGIPVPDALADPGPHPSTPAGPPAADRVYPGLGGAYPPMSGAVKRLIDVVAAMAGLALLAPVFAVVALAIRLAMGRPVLFRQVRPGFRGRPFTL